MDGGELDVVVGNERTLHIAGGRWPEDGLRLVQRRGGKRFDDRPRDDHSRHDAADERHVDGERLKRPDPDELDRADGQRERRGELQARVCEWEHATGGLQRDGACDLVAVHAHRPDERQCVFLPPVHDRQRGQHLERRHCDRDTAGCYDSGILRSHSLPPHRHPEYERAVRWTSPQWGYNAKHRRHWRVRHPGRHLRAFRQYHGHGLRGERLADAISRSCWRIHAICQYHQL